MLGLWFDSGTRDGGEERMRRRRDEGGGGGGGGGEGPDGVGVVGFGHIVCFLFGGAVV